METLKPAAQGIAADSKQSGSLDLIPASLAQGCDDQLAVDLVAGGVQRKGIECHWDSGA